MPLITRVLQRIPWIESSGSRCAARLLGAGFEAQQGRHGRCAADHLCHLHPQHCNSNGTLWAQASEPEASGLLGPRVALLAERAPGARRSHSQPGLGSSGTGPHSSREKDLGVATASGARVFQGPESCSGRSLN